MKKNDTVETIEKFRFYLSLFDNLIKYLFLYQVEFFPFPNCGTNERCSGI